MNNLDDPAIYEKCDPQNMLGLIHDIPNAITKAWEMADAFALPPEYANANKIVILGMGGSAIGGDLVAGLLAEEVSVPIIVNRSYGLPAHIDENTLVIAASYSGNTEETISAFEKALTTEAKKIVITTGGKLADMAKEAKVPVFQFEYPAQPRAALAFNLLPILNFIQRLGFCDSKSAEVAEASVVTGLMTRKINEKVPQDRNPAKQLAKKLHGKLAVIYGGGMLAEVAHRWKTQLNENAKAWAFHNAFPEISHNAIVGYQFPKELAKNINVTILRSIYTPLSIVRRQELTAKLLKEANVNYQFIDGFGISPLAQMASLILIGDYVSYYLAILNNIDPTPIDAIDFLKKELSKEQ